ncbi:hypothetical protein V6C27_09965 [Peptococcaceae bacterium 1198_IL3148]
MGNGNKPEKTMGNAMAIGVALGGVLGLLFDNLALGIGVGVAIGAGIGIAMQNKKK